MWRARGAEVPAAAAPLPPPPTAARQPGSVAATSGLPLDRAQRSLPIHALAQRHEPPLGAQLSSSLLYFCLLSIALLPKLPKVLPWMMHPA